MEKIIINRQLGKGKYGQVFSVYRDNVEFALKVINKTGAKHSYLTWKNEILVLKRLKEFTQDNQTINVPQLQDFWEDEKKCYILMDIIEGKNLREMIQTNTLTETQIQSAVKTCKELNRLKIKHCDFHPKNVIWNEVRGGCFIIDFGCSRLMDKPVADNYQLFKMRIKQIQMQVNLKKSKQK